jgi:hypothetical protein
MSDKNVHLTKSCLKRAYWRLMNTKQAMCRRREVRLTLDDHPDPIQNTEILIYPNNTEVRVISCRSIWSCPALAGFPSTRLSSRTSCIKVALKIGDYAKAILPLVAEDRIYLFLPQRLWYKTTAWAKPTAWASSTFRRNNCLTSRFEKFVNTECMMYHKNWKH